MLTLQQIQEKKELIQTYDKVHTFVFDKLKKGTIVILSIALLLIVVKKYEPESTTIDPVIQSKITATFIKQKTTTTNNKDFSIFIKWWSLTTSGSMIIADNNLMQYKWFVTPRFLSIYKTAPIIDLITLDKGQYSIQDIDSVFQNIIFSPIQQNSTDSSQPSTIPLFTIANNFNIDCIYNIVSSPICESYVQNFVQYGFMYDWIWAEDVDNIHKALVQSKQRQTRYCESIVDHILYTKKNNTKAIELLQDCPITIQEEGQQLSNFRDIQEQLKNKSMQSTVYIDTNLNKYKLSSMRQALYNDNIQNKSNPRYIEQYIAYMQSLLKKNALTGAYIDMTYYYNNTYLLPYLYSIQNQNPSISNTNAIENIITLNKGSKLLWFDGLEKNMQNNVLIQQAQEANTITTNISIEALLPSISRFPYAQIKEQKIEWDIVTIQGILKLTALLVENKTVDFVSTLKQDGSILYVTSIEVKDQPLFNQALQNIIRTQTQGLTFRAIYQFINDSIAVYLIPKTEQNLCDRINQIVQIQTTLCGSAQIQISKFKNPAQIYTINLSGETITNISHPDKAITKALQQFVGIESDFIRLPTLIATILDTKAEIDQEETKITQTNIIRINDKLYQFLDTKLDDISYYNDIYFIQFQVQNINFIAQYDLQTHTIIDLYFKDVLMDKKPIAIKNINLTLSQTNQTNIDSFVSDPLAYIQSINLSAFTAYLQFSKEQK
jgi:hypothetical protein